ncbi:hypothetical protein EG329_004300 [Mollisiaceae sp. DMI_Dod_QoI]|nr:hypothetical protein EG329_004300 [Helotiales sp. DMI_Dod_QoI]
MAPSPPPPLPAPHPLRLVRKRGALTEVSISVHGIVQNEYLEVEKAYRDGTTYKFLENQFDHKKYNFVLALERMAPDVQRTYIANICIEIIVDATVLKSGGGSVTVLGQLSQLIPVLHLIENLIIKIEIPVSGTQINSYADYKNSSARQFLVTLIDKIRRFKSLKKMAIILALPEGVDVLPHRYIIPFYELDTFTHWRVKSLKYGSFTPQPISEQEIDKMNTIIWGKNGTEPSFQLQAR